MKWKNTSLNDELRTNHGIKKIKRVSHSYIRCLFRGQGSPPCLATLPDEEDDEAADEEDEKHADHGLPPHHAAHLLTVFAVVDRPAYFSRRDVNVIEIPVMNGPVLIVHNQYSKLIVLY